ncbi:hypothetical protein WZ342_1749 [Enterococcus faecalis]|nr:hypothetical protein WZ342_1749 [Enterococcus faecalis]
MVKRLAVWLIYLLNKSTRRTFPRSVTISFFRLRFNYFTS